MQSAATPSFSASNTGTGGRARAGAGAGAPRAGVPVPRQQQQLSNQLPRPLQAFLNVAGPVMADWELACAHVACLVTAQQTWPTAAPVPRPWAAAAEVVVPGPLAAVALGQQEGQERAACAPRRPVLLMGRAKTAAWGYEVRRPALL